MKRFFASAVVLAVAVSSASATDLNLTVQAAGGGSSVVSAGHGETVDYEIVGVLTDADNEGLALFGFDLAYTCGDITQLVSPAVLAGNCDRPGGITNPAGFGGTLDVPGREGIAVQVGCGQNTINNDAANAEFPTGSVITGVGQTSVVLATGSIVTPLIDGPCELVLTNAFSNVIRFGETGDVFYATDAAGAGAITNMTINVANVPCGVVSSYPPNCAVDAGQPSDPDGLNPVGRTSMDVTVGSAQCAAGAVGDDFTVSVSGGVAPTISNIAVNGSTVTLNFSSVIPVGEWTCVDFGGTSTCVGWLPADVDGNGSATAQDILNVIDNLNGAVNPAYEAYQCDADRSGVCGASDILRVIDLLNGADQYATWLGQSLSACPSE